MTTRIINETPGQRNRRLFVKAVAAGSAVVWEREDGGEYRVSSASSIAVHTVEIDANDDGQNIIRCSCQWGAKHGWMRDSGKSPLCAHMSIVRFYRLSHEDKLAIIEVAPDIRAALAGFGAELVAA